MPLLHPAYSRSVAWSIPVIKGALLHLRRLKEQRKFSLREANTQCYRIVGAGAALLSFEPCDVVASIAQHAADEVSSAINVGSERDSGRLAEVHARGLMSFVAFAKQKVRAPIHPRLLEFISDVIERHAAAYYAAEPDIHPEIAIGLLYDLAYATTQPGARKPYEIVTSILDELNSILIPQAGEVSKLDPEELKPRRALAKTPTDQGRPTKTTVDAASTIDHAPRLERLLVRRAQLLKTGTRSLTLERVEREIAQVRNWVIAANADSLEAPF